VLNAAARKRKDMADMAAAMEREFAEAAAEAQQEFESTKEESRNRDSEEFNVQKLGLEVGRKFGGSATRWQQGKQCCGSIKRTAGGFTCQWCP
jgi:hypothetical protein